MCVCVSVCVCVCVSVCVRESVCVCVKVTTAIGQFIETYILNTSLEIYLPKGLSPMPSRECLTVSLSFLRMKPLST